MLQPIQADGAAINASEGGLRIVVDAMVHQGDHLTLRVTYPDGSRIERARVAWSHPVSDGCVAGLERVRLI